MREFHVGRELFQRKEYSRAARCFEEVLQSEPHHARAWSYWGICLAHVGRAPEAEHALQKAVTLSPHNAECWFHLGVARSLEARWGAAAEAFRHAAALEPGDLSAWHRLGVSLAESGDREGSAAAFERALILSRETPREGAAARRVRGPVHDHLVEPAEREGPREAESWLALALSLLTLGELEEASAAYERAYTLDPDGARHSMFRPMLKLLTTTADAGVEELPGARTIPDAPTSPIRPPLRPAPPADEPPVTGVG